MAVSIVDPGVSAVIVVIGTFTGIAFLLSVGMLVHALLRRFPTRPANELATWTNPPTTSAEIGRVLLLDRVGDRVQDGRSNHRGWESLNSHLDDLLEQLDPDGTGSSVRFRKGDRGWRAWQGADERGRPTSYNTAFLDRRLVELERAAGLTGDEQ